MCVCGYDLQYYRSVVGLSSCGSFIYIGVLYYCMCLFSSYSGVPLDSP